MSTQKQDLQWPSKTATVPVTEGMHPYVYRASRAMTGISLSSESNYSIPLNRKSITPPFKKKKKSLALNRIL